MTFPPPPSSRCARSYSATNRWNPRRSAVSSPDETSGRPRGPRTSTIALRSPVRNAEMSALTASSRDSKLFCCAGAANAAPCRPITTASAIPRTFIAALRRRLSRHHRAPHPPPRHRPPLPRPLPPPPYSPHLQLRPPLPVSHFTATRPPPALRRGSRRR